MPTYETGNMWMVYGRPNTAFIFTANSTIRSDGALVMGRGIAKEVREKIPGIDKALGKLISLQASPEEFGLLILDYAGKKIGAFQVKTYYGDPASPALIKRAASKLRKWALDHPMFVINMNFPGIGYGHLPEDIVLPLIDGLPENVHIWKL